MAEEVILTKEGKEELEKRLEYLRLPSVQKLPKELKRQGNLATLVKTLNTMLLKTNRL